MSITPALARKTLALADAYGLQVTRHPISPSMAKFTHNLGAEKLAQFCEDFMTFLETDQLADLLNQAVAENCMELAGPARRMFGGNVGEFCSSLSTYLAEAILGWVATMEEGFVSIGFEEARKQA